MTELGMLSRVTSSDAGVDEDPTILSRLLAGNVYAEGEDDLEATNRRLLRAIEKLERLVYIDDLTGLANRRFFNTALESEIRRAVRERADLTLFLCDIDRFKRHNDTFGHRSGDALLRLIGRVLKRYCRRAGDCAARYGGEEFALILPQLRAGDALAVAEDLRQAVAALAIRHDGFAGTQRVTMSIGVTTFESGMPCATGALIDAADSALYSAKNGGRNQTRFRRFEG